MTPNPKHVSANKIILPKLDRSAQKDKDKENKRPSRPRRVANVAFPPAKFGLYLAITIIAVMGILMLVELLSS